MSQRPRVVYWNNIPAPYMIERFNAVASRGTLDFEAWFTQRNAPDRSWRVDEADWRFPYRYMKTGERSIAVSLARLASMPAPDLLVGFYGSPLSYIGWRVVHARHARTAFVCDGPVSHGWSSPVWWKEWLKRYAFRRADVTFCSGREGIRSAVCYGMADDRAMLLPHSIDVVHYRDGSTLGNEERAILRGKLGLLGTVFLYVGRLWHGKGLDYLLDAFERVQEQFDGDVSLLLVGDGEDEGALKKQCKEYGLANVVFTGFKEKAVIPRYYGIADAFVFPTLGDPYGLVLDEAMACSLPIISSSAAGEIRDRIEDDVNGWVVPPRDSDALAQRMLTLARQPEIRENFGKASYKKIRSRTPEQWAADFEKRVLEVLSMPKR